MNKQILGLLLLLCLASKSIAQNKDENAMLRSKLQMATKSYKAIVGVSVASIEDGDTVTLNNDHHYPMQSVYKFPLAIAVLKMVDEKKISLEQKVHVSKSDMHKTWSPLKVKYPDGNFDITVENLLQYSVSMSDNNACDLLFKLAGGPREVQQYIHSIGVQEISIVATEHQMHQAWKVQYTNWCTPTAMTKLLTGFHAMQYLSTGSNIYLMKLMIESSNSDKRLKGLLSTSTIVAHKTGSSGANKKRVTAACNDVGIMTLPDGKHLAIVVFVSDSKENYDTNEKIIAEVARICFDYFINKNR